jgi:hypothetical protein
LVGDIDASTMQRHRVPLRAKPPDALDATPTLSARAERDPRRPSRVMLQGMFQSTRPREARLGFVPVRRMI